MEKYYYAVRNGRKIGVFDNWKECSQSITNFSNQDYKKSSSKEEAYKYLEFLENDKNIEENTESENRLEAYVASQFNKDIGVYSFGNILVKPDGSIISNSNNGNEPNYIISQDASGRLLGGMDIIKQCSNIGCNSVVIYSPAEDMGNFYSGAWSTKAPIANDFKEFLSKHNNIKIDFRKVSKDKEYYKQAEELAKMEIMKFSQKKIDKHTDKCFVAKGIQESELQTIIELFKENENQLQITVDEKNYEVLYIFSVNKEKCILHYYKRKNKVMIQGKQTPLLLNLINYIMELVEIEKIPQLFNAFYNIDLSKTQIEELYKVYLSNVPENINNKIKNSLTQSIYNLMLTGDMYDASFLLFPSLRVTEGIIKKFMLENDIEFIDKLDMFEETKKTGKFKLKAEYQKNLKDMSKLEKIEKLYNFYHRQRHTLFHWGNPGVIDDTRELLNVHDAHELIKDNLKLINDYYI